MEVELFGILSKCTYPLLTINFNGIKGDEYAIDAKGDTAVIAVFNDFGDSSINRIFYINWLRQTFIDSKQINTKLIVV